MKTEAGKSEMKLVFIVFIQMDGEGLKVLSNTKTKTCPNKAVLSKFCFTVVYKLS